MASRSSSHRATPALRPGSRSRKAATSASPTPRSDSKSDELRAPKKSTPALSHVSVPSHTSIPAPVEPILVFKYSKADLMRILKIFLETKGQESKFEVPCKQLLKAKVPDVYFEKSHIDCYYFCQQCEDYFEIASATGSNRTPFTALFFCGKINFQ